MIQLLVSLAIFSLSTVVLAEGITVNCRQKISPKEFYYTVGATYPDQVIATTSMKCDARACVEDLEAVYLSNKFICDVPMTDFSACGSSETDATEPTYTFKVTCANTNGKVSVQIDIDQQGHGTVSCKRPGQPDLVRPVGECEHY